MEININCDLGEKSKLHNNENDPFLLGIVNSANVACGYHAGDEETMNQIVKIIPQMVQILQHQMPFQKQKLYKD